MHDDVNNCLWKQKTYTLSGLGLYKMIQAHADV